MKILFLGDIFGVNAIGALQQKLPKLIKQHQIDFVIAQTENASGRKGLVPEDYDKLKQAGVNAFTMGNHVWAKPEINQIIDHDDLIRPYNVAHQYPGQGTRVFKIKSQTLRITQLMGIAFNPLHKPWQESEATSFFDAFDHIVASEPPTDFHIVDFHGETTSEKTVFGLYVDGKATALIGTHTHVQTADDQTLPNGTLYISDVGMVGPIHSAIGADYDSVYQKMRFNARSKFVIAQNPIMINGVILNLTKPQHTIKRLQVLC